jgi:hypothetical protein
MSQAGPIDGNGTGPATPITIISNGGSAVPIANQLEILGTAVAAGTTPVETTASGNTVTVEVQRSQAIAATNATNVGLAAFDSAAFGVDANGFVTLKGGSLAIDSISPNSGTDPIVPDANGKVSIVGTGSVTAVGSLNTDTIQLTGLTNHAVLVGAGTATITKVAPSATSGVPLISQGSAADPAFGTALVAGGGTGNTTFTAYSLIAAGTTATGSFQNVSGVGTSGQVLTSNGAAALPTWQSAGANAFASINVQTFTASGTYTPTAGMLYCIIECVGPGGGGGGTSTCTAAQVSVGGGGAGGGYSSKFASAATIGASQTVTIGVGETAKAVGGGNGGTPGSTSVGAICVANAGSGGVGSAASSAVFWTVSGGTSGSGGTGDVVTSGGAGGYGVGSVTSGFCASGIGGNSIFGGSANTVVGSGAGSGNAGRNYGGGGSGGVTSPSNTQQTGGAGAPGFVRITEFI